VGSSQPSSSTDHVPDVIQMLDQPLPPIGGGLGADDHRHGRVSDTVACMCRRVVFIILAAAAAALGLTGCDPYPSSGVADGVGVSVILNTEGGAQTQFVR
jgi:hypothetical protein